MTFEELRPGARVAGLDAAHVAEIVSVSAFGPDALNIVFRANGKVGERLVFREEAQALSFQQAGRAFSFEADGTLLKLASEALRIRLAYLFDPYLAVNSSQIEALLWGPFSTLNDSTHLLGQCLAFDVLSDDQQRARVLGY